MPGLSLPPPPPPISVLLLRLSLHVSRKILSASVPTTRSTRGPQRQDPPPARPPAGGPHRRSSARALRLPLSHTALSLCLFFFCLCPLVARLDEVVGQGLDSLRRVAGLRALPVVTDEDGLLRLHDDDAGPAL